MAVPPLRGAASCARQPTAVGRAHQRGSESVCWVQSCVSTPPGPRAVAGGGSVPSEPLPGDRKPCARQSANSSGH